MVSAEKFQAIQPGGLVLPPAAFTAATRRVALAVGVLVLIAVGHLLSRPGPEIPLGTWYLPTHMIVEVFSIVVSAMAFAVGWHYLDSRPPLGMAVLAGAFLAVALLDLGHTLSFPGMPVFVTESSPTKGIIFWLAARSAGVIAMLAVALMPRQEASAAARRAILAVSLAAVAFVYWLGLLRPDLVPPLHIEGQGLTLFKTVFEYGLAFAYGGTAWLLLHRALRGQDAKLVYLAAAAAIMALSELCFTVYVSVYTLPHIIGHLYKVIACGFLYWALYVANVKEPYALLRQSQEALVLSEKRFRSLMEFAPDAFLLIDSHGRVADANRVARHTFSVSKEPLTGVAVEALIPDWSRNYMEDEVICQTLEGQTFPAEVRINELDMPGGRHSIAVVRDVTERRNLQRRLLDQLSRDVLTGLPNRKLIIEKLGEVMSWARRSGARLAVMYMDLDSFKRVNDACGHAAGDQVLRECVERLKPMLPPGSILARQGSDEFIIVQGPFTSDSVVAELAERLVEAMRVPFNVAGTEVFLTASIGISVYPEDATAEETLIQRAHLAMESLKRCSRNGYCRYSREMGQQLRETLELEAALHHAVDNGELCLHYQPKVDLGTGTVVGVEALVRWQHPRLGLVPPSRFIPLAEESGLIVPIGRWVLDEACRQASEWRQEGLAGLRVSVNISARQLQGGEVVQQVADALHSTGLPAADLDLEITETAVMRNPEAAAETLRALKALGISVSLDDFGTGYASLGYLKRFPIDVVKIDRSFVREMATNSSDADIVGGVIGLVHRLGLRVVAEGVEMAEQALLLRSMECDEVQGYHFSPPVPAPDLHEVMAHIARKGRLAAHAPAQLPGQ